MKYVLLARPSSLIVTDMKKLMNATGMQPTPLTSLEELGNYNEKQVGGIVISTALSSPVKEKYWEVIHQVTPKFPNCPIFLASYASVKSTFVTAEARFKEFNIDHRLVCLDQVDESFSKERDILVLTQSEISDVSKFDRILKIIKRILNA